MSIFKKLVFISILFIGSLHFVMAFDGVWNLETGVMQVIDNGVTLGFADPETENKIEKIRFNDDEAFITYNEKEYETQLEQREGMLILNREESENPIIITLLQESENTYRYSYNLADAKDELNSAVSNRAFVNYVGVFSRQNR